MTIEELAARCREESSRPGSLPGELSACLELFRRALVENDTQAWLALYAQYRRLIGRWGGGSELELDELVNETFARFWQGLRGRSWPLATIQSALGYLKRCARTLAIDAARRRGYQQLVAEAAAQEGARAGNRPEEVALERVFSQELRAYLHGRLQDEDERLVFVLSYEQGWKPAEIREQHPTRFANAHAVYRIKERIVARLAQDATLRQWLAGEAASAGAGRLFK